MSRPLTLDVFCVFFRNIAFILWSFIRSEGEIWTGTIVHKSSQLLEPSPPHSHRHTHTLQDDVSRTLPHICYFFLLNSEFSQKKWKTNKWNCFLLIFQFNLSFFFFFVYQSTLNVDWKEIIDTTTTIAAIIIIILIDWKQIGNAFVEYNAQ